MNNPHLRAILEAIIDELKRAEEKHPSWPTDAIHAADIVVEESGELLQASLQHVYEDDRLLEMHQEALHTGAMAIRFLINFEKYE